METPPTVAAKSRRRPAASKPIPKSGPRIKTTIVMDGSVDFRLGAIASHLRMDRSTLAAKLIDDGLRRYALDAALRQFTDRSNLDDEASESAAASN